MEVLEFVLSSALSLSMTYVLVLCDRLRLSEEQRARGWNAASTAVAVLYFSPFCIIAHFWVTRRSLRGIGLGLLWFVLFVTGLSLLFSLPLPHLAVVLVLHPLLISLSLPAALFFAFGAGV